MRKPRVLVIGNSPIPPFDGGNIHIYNLLKYLSNKVDIYFIYYTKYGDTRDHHDFIKNLGLKYFCGVKSILPFNNYWRLKCLLSRYPYLEYNQKSLQPNLLNTVNKIIDQFNIDILHLWNVSFAYFLKNLIHIPKILTTGDSFSLMHSTFSKNCSFINKLYHKRLSTQFRNYEKEVYSSYNVVVFFTERDKKYANLPGNVRQYIIPNGVDIHAFRPLTRQYIGGVPKILFHGNFKGTIANKESAIYLVETLYPYLIKNMNYKFELWIIGRGAHDLLNKNKNNDSLKIFDYVDDLPMLLNEGTIYIAPIFSGSGIKNKVLEAMAVGLPVIGTPEAFEGIEIENGVHGIIANKNELPEKLIELIYDKEKRDKIGKNANQFIVNKFSWEKISERYIQLYNDLL